MQALTDDLLDILAARFQAAARGYRCRVEIDYIIPGVAPDVTPGYIQHKSVTDHTVVNLTFDTPVTVGSLLIAVLIASNGTTETPTMAATGGWTQLGSTVLCRYPVTNSPRGAISAWYKIAGAGDSTVARSGSAAGMWMVAWEIAGGDPASVSVLSLSRQTGSSPVDADLGALSGDGFGIVAMANSRSTDQANNGFAYAPGAGWTELIDQSVNPGPFGGFEPWIYYAHADVASSLEAEATITVTAGGQDNGEWAGIALLVGVSGGTDDVIATEHIVPRSVSIDKSRRLAAAEATLDIPNEAGALDLSPDGHIKSHHPIRIWQWYGADDNEVRTFTGFVDAVREGRDIRTVSLTCRDVMKRLIVQTFSATAPQGADEAGAVRTAANGVYLETEVSDIVIDILNRAGWPSADRAITPTSYVLDEYIVGDGSTWAESIIAENGPTGLTGYEAWADELGVFHFAPMLASAAADSDTDPEPEYSYVVAGTGDNLTSRNILRLDHDIDDYDTKTRVKARGNLAIAVPAWTELWHTSTFTKPVGIWYASAEPNHIRVLDRGTKKIYRYKTSSPRDRDPSGIWPLYVGGDVTYPLGLSGDPADSDRFWVLEAAWRATGSANLNASIHKYDASSGAHLAEYSLPDGEWSDIKVSSSYLWLTNKTTDKVHKRSKTDGSSIASYTTTYNANAQQNPTGVFVDGTTLGVFFLGHARFLLLDESDPTTIDTTNALGITAGKVSTAGTSIYGGEIDTDTDAHLYACSDDLGLVWKFVLTEPSTKEVFSEVVDTDLEDELGLLAGAEDREHDTHPTDPDHAFEIRRETITLEKTITNIAQATETALRILDELAHRRETVDFGIVGHPGHQRGDLHQLTDPVTGLEALYVLDTYRDNMDERGYLGTAAYVPYRATY